MDKNALFIGKIYIQSEYYLNSNGLSLSDTQDDDKLMDVFLSIKEYVKMLERPDKEDILRMLPGALTEEESHLTIPEIKRIIEGIKTMSSEYQSYITTKLEELEKRINGKMRELSFEGNYPKYYKESENETLILEYDDDLYFSGEKVLAKRIAMLIRVKKTSELCTLIDVRNFSYLDLITKYADKLQSSDIRSFMIHLPNLNYLNEITEEIITRDIKYLELVENVLNGVNRLPKWYINVNKTKKDFEKTYMLYSLVPMLFIVSLVGLLAFRNSSTMFLVCYVVGFALNMLIGKYFGDKSYEKYHKEDDIR